MGKRPLVDLEGYERVDRMFRELEDKVGTKAAREALVPAIKPVLETSKALAAPISRRLARSLKARKPQYFGRDGRRRNKRTVLERAVMVGTRAELGIDPNDRHFWPSAWEYGFIHAKSGKQMGPRSYMRAALKMREGDVLRIFSREFRKRIVQFWKAGGRRGSK